MNFLAAIWRAAPRRTDSIIRSDADVEMLARILCEMGGYNPEADYPPNRTGLPTFYGQVSSHFKGEEIAFQGWHEYANRARNILMEKHAWAKFVFQKNGGQDAG